MTAQVWTPRTLEKGNQDLRVSRGRACGLTISFAVFAVLVSALGQERLAPLKPPDRSSPRATLKTFLEAGDDLGAFLVSDYLDSPSRAKFHQVVAKGDATVRCLNLSEIPVAARSKAGRAATVALYETLNRIPLPPWEAIPDGEDLAAHGTNTMRWVIPDTEIVLERTPGSIGEGEFLFSPETVARADEFEEKVGTLPYQRAVPLENLHEILNTAGGWMIPYAWVRGIPDWLRNPIGAQSLWKWIGLVLMLGVVGLVLRRVQRLSRWRDEERPFLEALAELTLPASILVLTPAVIYLALVQLNLVEGAAVGVELVGTAVMFLAGAWISWRIAPVVAEAVIASPRIAPESIDAHLIRICTRLLGIVVGIGLLAVGSDRLGLHAYGIIAGLGVGGLAIALAAQPTIENLIGGLSLFADKPVRVGDLCRYGSDVGMIEAIGIRSTRIRGLDRTLTTIPNAVLSKMPVVNLAQRDRMLIQSVIGVRYETSPEQLRYVLVKIREMLLGHPRVHPHAVRARFIGFGSSSLDIEVNAYVMTRKWEEFLGVREDVLLRVMDIVEQSGTGFAFPSQTLYFGRDDGLDGNKTTAAEAQVGQWRDEGRLPFPDFSMEEAHRLRRTVAYPPPGSPDAPNSDAETRT